eukprot:CAMPEP_0119300722 /NCGR_PEP_ID=MMETSP1333-20130426/2634_1 /TAXON_ID=418940 /ORGANISM="Scyphosphaera apsteinii, Strain RCC1455" /LENGTH=616 /DNA_ID=CAMNT_0007302597 /DNA_START=57 /DNA_END=1907 /DNA_ORIENTATION=+
MKLLAVELAWRTSLTVAAFIVALVLGVLTDMPGKDVMWQVFYWYSIILIITATLTMNPSAFFNGKSVGNSIWREIQQLGKPKEDVSETKAGTKSEAERSKVGFWLLMPSAFITWIFAKSITNAAVLGGYYGVLGGVGYGGWYISFWSAALVGYYLRTRHGYRSLTSAVDKLYGPAASLCFGLALLFRLFNEVWSNTAVVASFFGEEYSTEWWWSIGLSTAVPCIYVIMGGMRSSLFSDVLQAFLGVLLLVSILGIVGTEMNGLSNLWSFKPPKASGDVGSGETTERGWLPGWWTLFLAGVLQGSTSYPFMDPVLTDRTFLSTPRTMLLSFAWGGAIAFTFITLFSAIGIYGCVRADAVKNGHPAYVAAELGGAAEVLIMLVMMTSSLSTLDSTFTSVGKLFGLEFGGWLKLPGDARKQRGPLRPSDEEHIGAAHITLARFFMVLVGIAGSFYLLADTEVLNATTVSGTVVMGLGPPVMLMLFWRYASSAGATDGWAQSPLAFLFSFWTGVVWGAFYQERKKTDALDGFELGEGAYELLLGVNVYGLISCIGACALGFVIDQLVTPLTPFARPRPSREASIEDPITGEHIWLDKDVDKGSAQPIYVPGEGGGITCSA